jgi:hypothetical protein
MEQLCYELNTGGEHDIVGVQHGCKAATVETLLEARSVSAVTRSAGRSCTDTPLSAVHQFRVAPRQAASRAAEPTFSSGTYQALAQAFFPLARVCA